MSKVITVTGFKGGVGKTITAIHLAGYYATNRNYQDQRVLLIDGDENRSAREWAARGELPFKCVGLRQSIRYKDYEVVIIDTPGRPSDEDFLELAEDSDLIILPTKTDGLSLQPTLVAADLIKKFNYKILICASPCHPSKDGELLKKELRNNNYKVFDTTIRATKGFGLAAEQGVLIKEIKHPSRVASFDYNDLCAEIGLL